MQRRAPARGGREAAGNRLDPELAWTAVLARDAREDGRFVFGVTSTGIYCRPSCPARRPRRERVRFFASGGEAERAGFRPCRRCRPRSPASPTDALVKRACALLEGAEGPMTLAMLADGLGMSRFHLHRVFRRSTGVTPREFLRARRIERLKRAMAGGESVTGAVYAAGFGSGSRVYERARAELGMTPGAYRRGAHAERIRYATAGTRLGRILVATTARGICAVKLGAEDEALVRELAAEYPRARLEPASGAGARAWLAAVVARAEGRPARASLPLDLRATAFQRQVWQALQEIPPGETRSYAEVAASIGRPAAARAVAAACAANPVAVLVPCHRVVGGDGALRGYRWGRARKRALLEAEAAGNARVRSDRGAAAAARPRAAARRRPAGRRGSDATRGSG